MNELYLHLCGKYTVQTYGHHIEVKLIFDWS